MILDEHIALAEISNKWRGTLCSYKVSQCIVHSSSPVKNWIVKSKQKSLLDLFRLINEISVSKLRLCTCCLTLYVRETNIMLMQTGWIQVSCRVTWDPTCLPLDHSLQKIKYIFKILNSRPHLDLFLKNYPAFKGLKEKSALLVNTTANLVVIVTIFIAECIIFTIINYNRMVLS